LGSQDCKAFSDHVAFACRAAAAVRIQVAVAEWASLLQQSQGT
jgi:hypothetical protein